MLAALPSGVRKCIIKEAIPNLPKGKGMVRRHAQMLVYMRITVQNSDTNSTLSVIAVMPFDEEKL